MGNIELENGLGWLEDHREDGEIYLDIDIAPVSFQSGTSQRKNAVKQAIRSALSKLDYMITGDASFHLTWQLHEQKRLETSKTADLDNILKTLIDGCCGLDGVLIDDNQLDDVHVQWVNYYDYDNDKVIIKINFSPSETIKKNKLSFIEMDKDLYLPISLYEEITKRKSTLSILETQYTTRKDAINNEGYLRATRHKNKMQRVFHKTRLTEYKKLSKLEYINKSL